MNRRSFIKNALAVGGGLAGSGAWLNLRASSALGDERVLRPPGALPEPDFSSRCIQCMRCVDACPNQAIMTLSSLMGIQLQDTPVIRPRRQACMLCSSVEGPFLKCTEACPSGALQPVLKEPDIILQRVAIGTACIDKTLCYSYNNYVCGTCFRACPFPGKAMSLELWEQPVVHSKFCVGCGACERACIRYPQAIRVKKGLK